MNSRLISLVLAALAACPAVRADEALLVARWSFDEPPGASIVDAVGRLPGTVRGSPEAVSGAEGRAWRFDGALVSVPSAPALQFGAADFSLTAWVNPYEFSAGQQMIVGKNVYSANQREWGLMLDRDQRFRFYASHRGWKTIGAQGPPQLGHWHHVAVTVEKGFGRLYVNGRQEAEGPLADSIPVTEAPLTIGGTRDGTRTTQSLWGAVDEVAIYRGVLTPAAIRTLADKPTTPHPIDDAAPVELWTGGPMPKTADLAPVAGVEIFDIRPSAPGQEMPKGWMKGVHVAWHHGKLYASFGFNRLAHVQGENTKGEEALFLTSSDGGETWSPVQAIASGEGELGISHGVFLSRGDTLWAFHGAFSGSIHSGNVHTRAFTLDEAHGRWEPRGVVVEQGFWPLQEPLRMADGNWIMSGARVGDGNPAAVAVSHGDDLTHWDLAVIRPAPRRMWGESSVLVDGARVTNLARYGSQPLALVAESQDFGRTWTASRPSNLCMTTSRPYANVLSTGQRYLVCTTTADGGNRRDPLTIAVSRPGEKLFSRVWKVADGPGTYPAAVEHEGRLYVGWTGAGMQPRLARFPVSALAEPAGSR